MFSRWMLLSTMMMVAASRSMSRTMTGHGGQPCQLAGVFAAVAGDQLITAVLPWPCQRGDEDAVFLDAFGGFLHGRILPHLKGVIRERMQLRERNLNNYFLLRLRLFWMARAFCPVLSVLFFQALCSSCRHLILGTKKVHFFFSEEMSFYFCRYYNTPYDITTSRLDFSVWKRMKNLAR